MNKGSNTNTQDQNIPKCTPERVSGFVSVIARRMNNIQNPFGLEVEPAINGSSYEQESTSLRLLKDAEPTLVKIFTTTDELTKEEIESMFELLQQKELHGQFDELGQRLISIYDAPGQKKYTVLSPNKEDISVDTIFPKKQ
jgi:hypothetical protein